MKKVTTNDQVQKKDTMKGAKASNKMLRIPLPPAKWPKLDKNTLVSTAPTNYTPKTPPLLWIMTSQSRYRKNILLP